MFLINGILYFVGINISVWYFPKNNEKYFWISENFYKNQPTKIYENLSDEDLILKITQKDIMELAISSSRTEQKFRENPKFSVLLDRYRQNPKILEKIHIRNREIIMNFIEIIEMKAKFAK